MQTTSKTRRQALIGEAEEILGITCVESSGGRLAHWADETRAYYWITLDDLRTAIAMRGQDDVYSHWCAATGGREVSARTVAAEGWTR